VEEKIVGTKGGTENPVLSLAMKIEKGNNSQSNKTKITKNKNLLKYQNNHSN